MSSLAITEVTETQVFAENRSIVWDGAELAFESRDLNEVVTHTLQVFSAVETMRKSAVSMCISLKKLKESYTAARREANPERKSVGWEAFCKANFESLGLSQGQIRTAIRTGEMLINLQTNDPNSFAAMSRLSRAALFAVNASPETVPQISAMLIESPDSTVTAKQVKELSETLAASEAQAAALKEQLEIAVQGKREAESVAADLNQRCLSAEEHIHSLRKQGNTPVDPPTHVLPPGIKNEQEALDSLNEKKSAAQQALSQTSAEVESAQRRLTDVQRRLDEHTSALDVISGLRKDVGALTKKYSLAMLQKTKDSSPNIQTKLRETGQLLRVLANQLEQ